MDALWASIWFLLVLRGSIDHDYNLWKQEKTIKHKNAWHRALWLMPSFLAFFIPDTLHITTIHLLLKAGLAGLMIASVWWEFFDGWFNVKRGFAWRFNGSNDPDDAHTDNFLQQFSPFVQGLIKWFLIGSSILGYILIS